MIQRQARCGESLAAVLTVIMVAGKEISAVEFDGFIGNSIIGQQPNHPRHDKVEIDRGNPVVLVSLKASANLADFFPALEIVIGIRTIIAGDNLGMITEKKGKRSPGADDTQCHEVFVQHKHSTIKSGLHLIAKHPFPRKNTSVACIRRLYYRRFSWIASVKIQKKKI